MDEQRKAVIELEVKKLQRAIWDRRTELLPGNTPSFFHVLEPCIAAEHLGFQFQEVPSLGCFGNGRERFEVAGCINHGRKLILISTRFSLAEQRFTGAHELGHCVLHPSMKTQHHDRPVQGTRYLDYKQPPLEREASYFAACYSMPRLLVEKVFREVFGYDIASFPFSENIAWQLCPDDHDSIVRPHPGSRSRALALASYRGSHYQSLAKCFNVSPLAMAIRLEELGLRAEWP